MKQFLAGAGAVLIYLSLMFMTVIGILAMYASWGLVGVIIGVFMFPVATFYGVVITCFLSVTAFIQALIWFGLLTLMIVYGESNE